MAEQLGRVGRAAQVLSLPFHQRNRNMPFTNEVDHLMHTPSSIHLASYDLLSSCYTPGTVFSARDRVVSQTDGRADPP